MSLTAKVKCEGYQYMEKISSLTPTVIDESKARFSKLKASGVIIAGNYNDSTWTFTDGVHKAVTINFGFDEIGFTKVGEKKIGCSLNDVRNAQRVLLTSAFGTSLKGLQGLSKCIRIFLDALRAPQFNLELCTKSPVSLQSFLELLPGGTPFKYKIIDYLADFVSATPTASKNSRTLCHYSSYFTFGHYLDLFWVSALITEKILYFPIYFWWKISGPLPLRPTECVLTPRNCLRRDQTGDYLRIRRTICKGTILSFEYDIDKDYEIIEYPIPKEIADEIELYLEATNSTYDSDIDVLFSKADQFKLCNDIFQEHDRHYTYANLRQCLNLFYRNILVGKYHLTVVGTQTEEETLPDNHIQHINLGDSRHIAMISLIISGQSPSICKELAGHNGFDIGPTYYSNVKSFLNALSISQCTYTNVQTTEHGLIQLKDYLSVKDGYCLSKNMSEGCFDDCALSITMDGNIGNCYGCPYYFRKGGTALSGNTDSLNEQNMLLAYNDFRHALSRVRKGLACPEELESMILRFQAEAAQYVSKSAIYRRFKEDKANVHTQ